MSSPEAWLSLAATIIKTYYPQTGQVRGLEFTDGLAISSQILFFETDQGRLCLKFPLYKRHVAQTDHQVELLAWQLIGTISEALRTKGVSLEEHLPTSVGTMVGSDGRHIFRVVRRISGRLFAGTDDDLSAAGAALALFHRHGTCLVEERPELRPQASRLLGRDMQILDSLSCLDRLRADLYDPDFDSLFPHAAGHESLDELRSCFKDVILPAAEWAADYMAEPLTGPQGFVHLDFHQGNVLYEGGQPVILDLEQLDFGHQLKCLGFSLSRFAFAAAGDRWGERLQWAVKQFMAGYLSNSKLSNHHLVEVPSWIRLYELEKILRILRRCLYHNAPVSSLARILSHHLPICVNHEAFRFDA